VTSASLLSLRKELDREESASSFRTLPFCSFLGISFLQDLLFGFPLELPESSPASLISSILSSVERMEATSVHLSESEQLSVGSSGSTSASLIGET
jgi:hypothetical protein